MAHEQPVTQREDIQPFLFPCGACKQYIFHGVYVQPYGFTVGLRFLKKPLWSANQAFQVICERCSTINGRLQPEDVEKLATNCLPKSIFAAYPALHQFYSPGYYDAHRSELVGDPPDPELAPLVDKWMGNYRLEI